MCFSGESFSPASPLKQKETYEDIKIATELLDEHAGEAKETLSTFQDIFSDVPGKTYLVEWRIRVTTDTPVHVRQYLAPFATEKAVEYEAREMLKQGIIEPSNSDYQPWWW